MKLGVGDVLTDNFSAHPTHATNVLHNRVTPAAESRDQATVRQFTPMTLMAYQQPDRIDADARFHMAMLLLHTLQQQKRDARVNATFSIQRTTPTGNGSG